MPTPAEPAPGERVHRIRRRLLAWYDRSARDLPWRRSDDPYAVWVSEIMLQQTRVETVVPYFERWMERFPTVEALAGAEEGEVLSEWEGLGYYSRARNLRRGAALVRDRFGGKLPADPADLREIPGIGAYTSGAVASIAFGVPAPAVDGNVRRVISRVEDLADPGAAGLRRMAARWVDPERPGDFNQALMELGATVCSPRAPACASCPVEDLCRARAAGTVYERPPPRRRARVRSATFVVLVAEDPEGRLLLGRRPDGGLLAGMWAFPEAEVEDGSGDGAPGRVRREAEEMAGGLGLVVHRGGTSEPLPAVDHRYSHIAARYLPVRVPVAGAPDPDGGRRWLPPGKASELPLPRVQRAILEAVLERRRGRTAGGRR